MSILDKLKGGKNEMLEKMVKLPEHVTHVGLANVDGNAMTIVAMSELSTPIVYDVNEKKWVQLVTKIGG